MKHSFKNTLFAVLTLLALFASALGVMPVQAASNTVLVLRDGSSENAVIPFLTSAGFTVISGPLEYLYDGTNPSLTGIGAVLFLDGNSYSNTMPSSGQIALNNFVNNGGGLVITEWFAYERGNGQYGNMAGLQLIQRSSGNETPETYTVVNASHPIAANLPTTFAVPYAGYNVGNAINGGEVIINGSGSGAAVVAKQINLGRVVQMATATGYSGYNPWNADMQTLLINELNWVSGSVSGSDTTAPTVTAFTATSPSTSLNIPITSFTASDDTAVTGYMITTSSAQPSAGAAGWTGTAPTTYTVSGPGSYTLYPWAKDAAGNVSAAYGSPADVTINAGNALNFDGANDYVAFTRPIQDDFTIEFWVKTTQSGTTGQWYQGIPLVDGEVGGVANDFGVSLGSGSVMFGVGNPDITINSGSTTINNGAWHHVAATRQKNTGTMLLYVDGVQVASGSGQTGSLTAPSQLMFGTFTYGGTFFQGVLDEVRVWNVARTQAQLQADMNNEIIPQAGLVAYYRLDQGVPSGNNAGITTALDGSGNGLNGTLNNFALTGSTSNWVTGIMPSLSDTTAPTVTAFAATSPSTSLNIPITSFTGSDDTGVTDYMITTSSTQPLAGDAGWSGTAPSTYTVGSDGSYTLYPWAKDAAGNVSAVFGSPVDVVVDTTGPDASIDSQPADPSASADASFEFSSADGTATFECELDGAGYAPCSGPMDYFGLSDGSHTFSVQATDSLGNTGSGASYTWTIDTTGPDTNIDLQPSDPSGSADANFEFSSTDGTATFECDLDGAGFAPCSGPMDYFGLSDGSHTFSVQATDSLGNTGSTASYTWTIDTYVASERLKNGGLNVYSKPQSPKFWTTKKFTLVNGQDLKVHSEGTASVKITGEVVGLPVTKVLQQTIALSGVAGDEFTFSFKEKGKNIPAAGLCQAQVILYNGTTVVETQTVKCDTGTHGFTLHTLDFTASSDFTNVVVKFTYKKKGGTVWFDEVSLIE